ncbi:carbohydrate kinase family protein [Streptomyces vinaceus]|uniref:carbohydrate kinase family protein n=1 Tax=Streptomyces vinaceus TaxID=1960 RepID=UPI0019C189A8|nr:carbohydrate kinase [Streptomyces vinaceus]GHE29028.1 ribokinase [Streptomyces vinaceus]
MSSATTPTLVIGEAITDVLTGEDGVQRARPGGSPANVALGLARLGHPVRLATRIGRDGPGRELHAHLRSSGVVLTPGSHTDGPTSTATARLDAAGTAHYGFDITWDLPPGALDGPAPAHVHTGSLATVLAPGAERVFAAVEAARAGATVSYDPNIRPALLADPERERQRAERFVALSDVVKASEEDLGLLRPGRSPDETARRWVEGSREGRGPALVVVTMGGAGARVFWPGGRCEVPATAVGVADTVGAGDAFMAGLLSGLLRTGLLASAGPPGAPGAPGAARARTALREATARALLDPRVGSALSLAARAAALTCTREGADPPTHTELARWAAGR